MSECENHRHRNWDITRPYDQSAEAPSEAVVSTVAAAIDRDVLALDPLYRSVDTDALDQLIRSGPSDGVALRFDYAGCMVWIDGETVAVSRRDIGHTT